MSNTPIFDQVCRDYFATHGDLPPLWPDDRPLVEPQRPTSRWTADAALRRLTPDGAWVAAPEKEAFDPTFLPVRVADVMFGRINLPCMKCGAQGEQHCLDLRAAKRGERKFTKRPHSY